MKMILIAAMGLSLLSMNVFAGEVRECKEAVVGEKCSHSGPFKKKSCRKMIKSDCNVCKEEKIESCRDVVVGEKCSKHGFKNKCHPVSKKECKVEVKKACRVESIMSAR